MQMVNDIRVSGAIGTADVSALGAGLGGRVEESTAAVAVSPHALDGLLQDEILLRRSRGLRDLQAVLLGLLDNDVDSGVFVLIDLLREPGALLAALVTAATTDILSSKVLLALVALAVHAHAGLLGYTFLGASVFSWDLADLRYCGWLCCLLGRRSTGCCG